MKLVARVAAVFLILTAAGCVSNHVPFYIAGKTEAYMEARKQNEQVYWTGKIKERRITFERDLDAFYVDTLKTAQENNLLTPEGVVYLDLKVQQLRNEFDANEAEAIQQVATNLKFYDDIAALQAKVVESVLDEEETRAKAFQAIAGDVESFATEMAKKAAERRASSVKDNDKPSNDDKPPVDTEPPVEHHEPPVEHHEPPVEHHEPPVEPPVENTPVPDIAEITP
jgi:hypothetical protein